MGEHREQPQRVPAAARRGGRGLHLQRLHLHAAQPQLPPPPPLLRRGRGRLLPDRPRRRRRLLRRGRRRPPPHGPRRRLPQCRGAVPGVVLLPVQPRRCRRRRRALRRRRRPRRAGGRDVPRRRRRHLGRRGLRPPQEAHDQEPRVRRALPRAQAGLRPRAGEEGADAAGREREPPRQVRPAEGVRGGGGADCEEDSAEDAVRAILRTLTGDQSKQVVALFLEAMITD